MESWLRLMSETSFPVNDLLRRRLQTGLVIVSLTLSVASTMFLFLLGDKLGVGILSSTQNKLTFGFWTTFWRFILFSELLIFIIGIVIVSFMAFIMMSQRVKDIGLMRASGCPNNLIFGYFMTELLIVTAASCFLGLIFGILAYFAASRFFQGLGGQVSLDSVNLWLVVLVFAAFFLLSVIFGAKPVLDSTKVKPAEAISPTHHLGLNKEPGFKSVSKSGFVTRIALRSLFRRTAATIRVVVCLTAVFVLVTVGVAGATIANQTTGAWVENAVGRDIVLIGHADMCEQYRLLLSKFYESHETSNFNYTDSKYLISNSLLSSLDTAPEVVGVDARLVLESHVREIPGLVLDPDTHYAVSVGDSRAGDSLIVGIDPEKALSEWFVNGQSLKKSKAVAAMIGDSIAQKMFSAPLNQSIMFGDSSFDVEGVCLDPINNGYVTYVNIGDLEEIVDFNGSNIVLLKVDSTNRTQSLDQVKAIVHAENAEFAVVELNETLNNCTVFLGSLWSSVGTLPLFALFSAFLCLVGYVMLVTSEQRQEFGILRAVGAKPKTIVKIVSVQTFTVLFSSFAAGISLGIMITLLILIPEPLVTSVMLLQIAGWLLATLITIFVLSLYPAIKFAKQPILELMA
jgi:ABC-type antimicrobial peptide transport system permease subunit